MATIPAELKDKLSKHGQEHVLAWWNRLEDQQKRELIEQLASIDFEHLAQLYQARAKEHKLDPKDIQPVPVLTANQQEDAVARQAGEQALREGQVALLVVAGGQGTRLGFDRPKGMYPVGPVTGKTLFQIHVEKVLALGRRYGKIPPLLIMTSHATHEDTVAYFEAWNRLGLPPDRLHYFQQGTMPALDANSGKLLLEDHGRLFLSPDGHGGTLTALARSGLLGSLKEQGIHQIFYFQVDNPLVQLVDPVYLGHHILREAEISNKVIAKSTPEEKMGVFAMLGGTCQMIEYSNLPPELAFERDEQGNLKLWAGNPAIHIFDVDFLIRMTDTAGGESSSPLPFHVARKKVPHLHSSGEFIQPEKENALKFERFIFDLLPHARKWLLVEGDRAHEFAPLKNARSPDSPADVRRAMTQQAAEWLESAGITVPRNPDGSSRFLLEISPLFALDATEFAQKVDKGTIVDRPQYFGG